METVFEQKKEQQVGSEVDQFDLSKEIAFTEEGIKEASLRPALKVISGSSGNQSPSPKKNKSVWEQIKGGLRAAWNILYPATLVLWLGGGLLDKAIKATASSNEPAVSNPLPAWLVSKAEENSTSAIQFDSKHSTWKGLVTFRVLLGEYSQPLEKWMSDLYRDGKIEFVNSDRGLGETRYSDYRKWSGKLTLFPSFFTLSDAKKMIALEHEHAHSQETLPGYISSSVTPQVITGAMLRAFGFNKELKDLGHSWSYYGNSSEVAAIEAENKAAIRLGQTDLVLDDYKFDKVIPGQTLLGVFAAGSSLLSFLKRRKAR